MNGYCFMSIQKVKTSGGLMSKYNHNFRIIDVDNAAVSLRHLNEELVSLPVKEDGYEMNFNEVWKERIGSLPYYRDRKPRRDAVKALELVLTYSHGVGIDLEAWKKKNVEWLDKTFNIAGDGRDNVISVVYHGDEAGNDHLHAIVIPIDEKGHLNASRFVDGSKRMTVLQNSYARDMAPFGLRRGTRGSSAKHKDIRKFYADLNAAIRNIPEPLKNESAEEYVKRAAEYMGTINAAALRQLMEREDRSRKKIEKGFKERLAALQVERDRIEQEKRELVKDIGVLAKEKEELEASAEILRLDIREMVSRLDFAEEDVTALDRYRRFQRNFSAYKKDHPMEAESFGRLYERIVDYGDRREQEKENSTDREAFIR